jgi:hypothetical protein
MKRRDFIALLGGAATWPLAARAQQPIPLIGFLHAGSLNERVHLVAALREGLRAGGYIEGQNVTVDYRWAEDQFDVAGSLCQPSASPASSRQSILWVKSVRCFIGSPTVHAVC